MLYLLPSLSSLVTSSNKNNQNYYLYMDYHNQIENTLAQRVHDLEHTLSINKGIILTLTAAKVSNKDTALIITKLTEETDSLHKAIASKAHEEYIIKYFNAVRQIEEYKSKQEEYTTYLNGEIASLKQQLQLKEYSIQYLENKIIHFTKSLRRESIESKKLGLLLNELNKKEESRKSVHNLIDENEKLSSMLKEKMREINCLRNTIDDLSSASSHYEPCKIEELERDMNILRCKTIEEGEKMRIICRLNDNIKNAMKTSASSLKLSKETRRNSFVISVCPS